jgi:hypothetical protein
MDLHSVAFAQFAGQTVEGRLKAEDAYYRQHEARRTVGWRLLLPLIVGFGACLAALGLIQA